MSKNPSQASAQACSCLTDKPVTRTNDRLNAYGYASALCEFIRCADTPVTIGIQGGWGSGKTSLISLMRENLEREKDPDNPILCVFVNAWEHSLFQSHDNTGEVALSLLGGLARGLESSIAIAHKNKQIDAEAIKGIIDGNQKITRAIGGLKIGFIFASKVAAQMVSNMVGGGDISKINIKDPSQHSSDKLELPQMASHVRSIRVNLQNMVRQITIGHKQVKIVFFIDDLDRVPPATAVEMLDVTKNIFDIEGCIFVLAIDYEVVVKGLEKKFGVRTDENEREFRQYFDKIIQIPFSMPIGAFSRNVDRMLNEALVRLGYHVGEETLHHLAQDACLATGGIPRSIKRIINTLSLLEKLNSGISSGKAATEADLEARFIIVALHINFPKIMERIMEFNDYANWDPEKLDRHWKLESASYTSELKALANDGLLNKYFDDKWEKVVYCLCAKNQWLKSQATNVSKLMNRLMDVLVGSPDPKELTEQARLRLKNILETIRVVSIDFDKVGVAFDYDDRDMRTDKVSQFCKVIHHQLCAALPPGSMPAHSDEYAEPSGILGFLNKKDREYTVTLPKEGEKNCKFFIIWRESEKSLKIGFEISPCNLSKEEIYIVIHTISVPITYYRDGKQIGSSKTYNDWGENDFIKRNPADYIDDIKVIFNEWRAIAKELIRYEEEKAQKK